MDFKRQAAGVGWQDAYSKPAFEMVDADLEEPIQELGLIPMA